MKRISMLFAAVVAVAAGAALAEDHAKPASGQPAAIGPLGPKEVISVTPDGVKYQPGPASLPVGVEMAVVEGDPKVAGMFTIRLKLPANYKIPPHWHPGFERITVLSGTFQLGMGEKRDEKALKDYPAGSYLVMPPKHGHFAGAKGGAVLQLTSMGPWDIVYFNRADDPRAKAER